MNKTVTQWILGVSALSFVLYVTLSHTPVTQPTLNIQPDFSEVELEPVVDTTDYLLNVPVDQLICMATNIYHEARGESERGMIAVGHVTLNRAHHSRFPDSVCDVVYQGQHRINWKGNRVPVRNKCQFSWYCDGRSDTAHNQRAWERSLEIAKSVLLGEPDPTNGALFYYNPKKAKPYWREQFVQTAVIDDHRFMTL